MSELSPRARDLFARARASATPTVAERARVLDRVEAAVAPSVPPPSSAVLPTIGVSALVVVATMLSMVGSARAPEPSRVVVDPPPIAAAPAVVHEEVPTISEPAIAPAPIRVTPTDPLTEELRLLRRAQSARRAHRYPAALAALREHASRFPDGTLASERDVTRILVLCESGRRDEGRALASDFTGSAWSASIDEACADSIETP